MGKFGPQHRKIPVPRRHGVRDPLKRLAERESAIKDKINNPPKEHDVQEVSHQFRRFVALKEKANRESSRHGDAPRNERRVRPQATLRVGTTVVQKGPKESEASFLNRATQLQADRSVEADFSVKFGVEIERDEQTGAIKISKRKGSEVDDMLKKSSKQKLGKNGKPIKRAAKAKKLTLNEKRALKKQKVEERKNKEDDLLLREYQYDNVPFGEVVKGPPTLHTLPRKANKQAGGSRPASKRLLLHSLIDPQAEEDEQPAAKKRTAKKAVPSKVDLKGKRKNLPMATRMKIEREQQSVIEMYRKLKKAANQ